MSYPGDARKLAIAALFDVLGDARVSAGARPVVLTAFRDPARYNRPTGEVRASRQACALRGKLCRETGLYRGAGANRTNANASG